MAEILAALKPGSVYPQNIVATPTGSTGHSRGLHHNQHSAGWHPHCRCSTRGAPLPPQPGASGREEWRKSGTAGAVSQVQGCVWQAWGCLCGAFLTSVFALQGWAWGRGAGSTGMLKPLASSRAASSVSCEQERRELLPALGPGSPPSVLCGLTSQLHPLPPAISS